MRKNPSLKNKFGSRQKDGGANIDQLTYRAEGGTKRRFDWQPTTGTAFRENLRGGVAFPKTRVGENDEKLRK